MYPPCSPGKRNATGEQALLAQIQLINGEADIIGGPGALDTALSL